MQINSTEAAGLLAFVPAALSAALASVGAARSRTVGQVAWAMIALIFGLLASELLAGTRFRIDDALRHFLRQAGAYGGRRPVQAIVVFLVAGFAGFAILALARLAPTRSLAVATSATATVVGLFVIEIVSLHAMDGFLYGSAGPILMLGWLWLVCGWTTTAAAGVSVMWTDPPRRRKSDGAASSEA